MNRKQKRAAGILAMSASPKDIPFYSQDQIDFMLEDAWQADLRSLGPVSTWTFDGLKQAIHMRKFRRRMLGDRS